MGASQFYTGSSLEGSMMAKTGIDRRYESIKDIKQPTYRRDKTKQEGNIAPDKGSTIKVAGKKQKVVEPNPYETQIAMRMRPNDGTELPEGHKPTGFPKVTFAAQ